MDEPKKADKGTHDSPRQVSGATVYFGDDGPEIQAGRTALPELDEGEWVTVRDAVKARSVTGRVTRLPPLFAGMPGRLGLADAQVSDDPLPQIVGGKLRLSNLLGHAHSRSWAKGDIVEVHGQHYRVTNVKPANVMQMEYSLTPVSAKAWATRPGRKLLRGVDAEQASLQVGRAIQVGSEWLAVEKIASQAHREDAGMGEIVGRSYYAVGRFVAPEKAAKMNIKWERAERVRNLEIALRLAQNPDMSNAGPEDIARIEAELTEARKAAGIKG